MTEAFGGTKKQIVLRFFNELWNERKVDLAEELFSPDCVTHQLRSGSPDAISPRTPAVLRAHVTEWLESFPDLRFTVEQVLEQDDFVTVAATAEGTHTGTWLGVPATGRKVSIRMTVTYRLEHNHIAEDWVLVDFLGVFQQLGLLPSTSQILSRLPDDSRTSVDDDQSPNGYKKGHP